MMMVMVMMMMIIMDDEDNDIHNNFDLWKDRDDNRDSDDDLEAISYFL